jgi:hypothetical protein
VVYSTGRMPPHVSPLATSIDLSMFVSLIRTVFLLCLTVGLFSSCHLPCCKIIRIAELDTYISSVAAEMLRVLLIFVPRVGVKKQGDSEYPRKDYGKNVTGDILLRQTDIPDLLHRPL